MRDFNRSARHVAEACSVAAFLLSCLATLAIGTWADVEPCGRGPIRPGHAHESRGNGDLICFYREWLGFGSPDWERLAPQRPTRPHRPETDAHALVSQDD